MLYFILWTVLLLTVVLSVPIVAFVESSRRKRALAAAQEGNSTRRSGEAADQHLADEAVLEVQVDEGAAAGGGEFGGEDFSVFDDAFEGVKK